MSVFECPEIGPLQRLHAFGADALLATGRDERGIGRLSGGRGRLFLGCPRARASCKQGQRSGGQQRAVEVMTAIEVIHPAAGEPKLVRGRALSALNRIQEARRAFMAAATLMPESPDALAALGLANDRMGDHISAQTAYRQALELSPSRPSTLSNLGLSLTLTGDIEEAEQVLREAAVLDPENTHIRQNLALVLGLQGRYDEMIEAAGDAPEEVMRRNADLLRRLRGDTAAATPAGAG